MTIIKVKELFDDENNIKWKTAFVSSKEAIFVFRDSIVLWGNRYNDDDNFAKLKERLKVLDREAKMLKVAYKKWQLEFKKNE